MYSSRPIAPGGSAPSPFPQPQGKHAQLLPPHGTRDRLKVANGAEPGARMFAMGVLVEITGGQLQQVAVDLELA